MMTSWCMAVYSSICTIWFVLCHTNWHLIVEREREMEREKERERWRERYEWTEDG